MKQNPAVLIVLMSVFLCQGPAQAKVMQGEVVAVKDDGSCFSFKRFNASKKPSSDERFEINVLPNTRFEKIGSLKELAVGDEVVVDAAKNKKHGPWNAKYVRIIKVQLYQETPEAKSSKSDDTAK